MEEDGTRDKRQEIYNQEKTKRRRKEKWRKFLARRRRNLT